MRRLSILVMFVLHVTQVSAQKETTINYTLTVLPPDPSCTLSVRGDLSFGTHVITRHRSLEGDADARSEFRLRGKYVSQFEVSVSSWPDRFSKYPVDLEFDWYQSPTGLSDSWTSISGLSASGTGGGLWTDVEHHFRIDANASWKERDITSPGSDTFTLDLTASCSLTL